MSHLSIEVGHLYMDELVGDSTKLDKLFARVRPLVDVYTAQARTDFGERARVSTCFMLDDYFHRAPVADVVEHILEVAGQHDVRIDYIGRERGCAVAYDDTVRELPLAAHVAARLVEEPVENTTGARPPTSASGWMCNGRRSGPDGPPQAMELYSHIPPEEFGRHNHSIFLDAQLWDVEDDRVRWSCPFLASVWQLLRLGLLRHEGRAVAKPQLWSRRQHWSTDDQEWPTIMQIEEQAQPFSAWHSVSVLPQNYLPIEHAVRVILEHFAVDSEVAALVAERAGQSRVELPESIADRMQHVFTPRL